MRSGTPPPRVLVGLAVVAAVLVVLPVVGLLVDVPWTRLPEVLRSETATDALRLSLVTSTAATVLAALLGLPLALLLARVDVPGRSALRGFVLLPLVLPPVVAGTALLSVLGRQGLLGGPLERSTGIVLPFSTTGAVLAMTFVAMPFLVITVEGALRGVDERYEGAAASLGAGPWTVLRRVTLPSVRSSVVAGLALTWARALGEFGATITFAGSLQGRTRTLPLAVFVALEADRDLAVALSLVLVLVSLAVVIGLRDHWWNAA